jgi:DNA polymerase-3 subunit gamma/tau
VERLAALESGGNTGPRRSEGGPRRGQVGGDPAMVRPAPAPVVPPTSESSSRDDRLGPAPPSRVGSSAPTADDLPSQDVTAAPITSAGASGGAGSAAMIDDAEPRLAVAAAESTTSDLPRTSPAAVTSPGRDSPVAERRDPVLDVAISSPAERTHVPPLDLATARKVWPDLIKKVGFTLGLQLSQVEPVAVVGPDVLVVAARPGYNFVDDDCGTPEALSKIEQGLERLTHRTVNVRYERSAESDHPAGNGREVDGRRSDLLASDPLVQKVVELFEARPDWVEYDDPGATDPT